MVRSHPQFVLPEPLRKFAHGHTVCALATRSYFHLHCARRGGHSRRRHPQHRDARRAAAAARRSYRGRPFPHRVCRACGLRHQLALSTVASGSALGASYRSVHSAGRATRGGYYRSVDVYVCVMASVGAMSYAWSTDSRAVSTHRAANRSYRRHQSYRRDRAHPGSTVQQLQRGRSV